MLVFLSCYVLGVTCYTLIPNGFTFGSFSPFSVAAPEVGYGSTLPVMTEKLSLLPACANFSSWKVFQGSSNYHEMVLDQNPHLLGNTHLLETAGF